MKSGSQVHNATAALRTWLKKSGIEPGGRIPPERKIAVELGVTHYAINRAVGQLVAEGGVKREGYKLYFTEPNLRGFKSPYVYIAANTSKNAILARKVARGLNFEIEVMVWDSLEYLTFVLTRLLDLKPDGILFEVPFSSHVQIWKPHLERLLAAQIPCVCVLQSVAGVSGVNQDYGTAIVEAFTHLVERGHRELALLSVPEHAQSTLDVLDGWDLHCHRHHLDSSLGRVHAGMLRSTKGNARLLAKILSQEWKNVTGLIAQDRVMIPQLVEELALRGRFVPADLSIICVGDEPGLKLSTPPISCVGFDNTLCLESAFQLLGLIAAKKAITGHLPRPQTFKLQPQMTLRGSTAPLNPSRDGEQPVKSKEIEHRGFEPWPEDPKQLVHFIEAMMRRSYPLAVGTDESRYQVVSLKKHLNRPLNFRRGWLGDLPLRNLGKGKQRIHGVVFDIENGTTQAEPGAVVFHSLKNSTARGKPLPDRIKVKVGCRAKAIYILHSCGFATFLNSFATYNFHTQSGRVDSVPLVVLGECPNGMEAADWKNAISKANIQDWWPDYFHTDFSHAKKAIVAQDKETLQSHRYIYTLEWVNPVPEEEIKFVEVRVDPMQPTTLGMIAMTVLKV